MAVPTEPLVRGSDDRGIRTLTLDSPHNRNALSARLRVDLADALAAAVADPDVRAVLIDAAGPAFCAGADLKEIAAGGLSADPAAPGMPDLFSAIMDAPKPVVARVDGPARAGGIGLVAAADIALAAETATFAFTEVRIGVVPAVISVPVARRMHDRQLSRYFLTGETFDAGEAERSGLITRAVPESGLGAAVDAVLDGLRAGAPRALARTKTLINGGFRERKAAFADMGALSAEFFGSDDAAEGRAAFLERRRARWVL
ncbi:enoyl-CoA hydratase/methylglutaconyl-CoA hydratase [Murinocardiopsis flavida]|uniref:Enoyl-CoA hydratase/methylglutaconyl-CoA hydratase n=1 Tax=Murinocardiopsis flavida TaxID=645275 RepID=A0A2P8DTW0_9ACTN|nr:enoyl-CoA hydratase-related protein [Murinocardiopsis flavida]PSL00660.1 enoyl-CoA hydratase/methylglutaconyl-CoA hydratase [Murinocardiopsis flavida]